MKQEVKAMKKAMKAMKEKAMNATEENAKRKRELVKTLLKEPTGEHWVTRAGGFDKAIFHINSAPSQLVNAVGMPTILQDAEEPNLCWMQIAMCMRRPAPSS